MVKAVLEQPNGRRLILLGLSGEDYRELAPGQHAPFKVFGSELGLDFDVCVFSGGDDPAMLGRVSAMFGVSAQTPADPPAGESAPARMPDTALAAAVLAARETLRAHGLNDPQVMLIAEDAGGSRGLGATVDDPGEMLRVALSVVQRSAG